MKQLQQPLLIMLTLVAVLGITFFAIVNNYRVFSREVSIQAEQEAHIVSSTLNQQFERVLDLGTSLSTRVMFRQRIKAGEWELARDVLWSIPRDFPFIDRIGITNPAGTIMADVPEDLSVRGKNFSYQDWYKGVSREWKPYTSEAYQRTAAPMLYVINFATPIKDDDGTILGILFLQVKLETLLEWVKDIPTGENKFIYFVDQYGHAINHPLFSQNEPPPDFSNIPFIQNVMGGQRGVGVLTNPFEKVKRLTAYAPISAFGWSAVIAQDTTTAFAVRNSAMARTTTGYAIALFLVVLANIFIFNLNRKLHHYNAQLEYEVAKQTKGLTQANQQLRTANQELEQTTKKLRDKIEQLEVFNKVTLGRELKMIELKKQIEQLRRKQKK